MTNSDRVRAKFRNAFCEENGDFFQIVVVGNYGKAIVLGQGRNIKCAWEDAAQNFCKEATR